MTKGDKIHAPKPVKSVAIIGAGASGAVAIDVLKKEHAFDKIVVYERRDVVGGVWHLDETPDQIKVEPGSDERVNDPVSEIPYITTNEKVLQPRSKVSKFIYTPAYENIRTNVPEHFMTYSDINYWPKLDKPDVDRFTTRRYVEQYIQQYLEPNKSDVVLRTTLEKVDKDYSDPNSQFILTLRQETDQINDQGELLDLWWKESFDALVLANGHYNVPHIPDVEGLKAVADKFPSKVEYAKQFRSADKYSGKKVLVIGGSASAIDISHVLSKVSDQIYRSYKTPIDPDAPADFTLLIDRKTKVKPIVSRYLLTDDGFDAIFNDGSVLSNPDYVIYGTGYDYSYPFLRELWPEFTDKGIRLPHSYRHTFFVLDPLISTIAVPVGALSFKGFEYQAIAISRFLSGKVDLPSREDQYQWIKEREERWGTDRGYHRVYEGQLTLLDGLTEIGGGVARIGEHGRSFPVVTQEDLDAWENEKAKLVERWKIEADEE